MNLEVFKFDKAELQVVHEQPGKIQVAMKPIVDALGLDWKSQYRNISEDPVLNSVMVIMTTTGADGKQYEMVCMPLDYLNGWLFKINANRYSGDRRDLIIRYQKECCRTLAERFGLAQPRPMFVPTRYEQGSYIVQRHAFADQEGKINAIQRFARNRGITNEDECIHLVKIAFGSESFSLHPATIARAVKKLSQS